MSQFCIQTGCHTLLHNTSRVFRRQCNCLAPPRNRQGIREKEIRVYNLCSHSVRTKYEIILNPTFRHLWRNRNIWAELILRITLKDVRYEVFTVVTVKNVVF
jgi:hypothetical protein